MGKQPPTYTTWHAMMQRCCNPAHVSYPSYGGAGIVVCERWKEYRNFLADMGERPEGMTLDRIDGTLGYFKENCRWATVREQQQNISFNRFVTYKGETLCVSEWARRLGIKPCSMRWRLAHQSLEKAMSSPTSANAVSNTGKYGVHWIAGRFRAQVKRNGKSHYLGRFRTLEEATSAVDSFLNGTPPTRESDFTRAVKNVLAGAKE